MRFIMPKSRSSEPGRWPVDIIRDFMEKSPEETLQNEPNEKAFGIPLVGFLKGDIPCTRTGRST